jgi:CBS domain containing-hemolysin-like protein
MGLLIIFFILSIAFSFLCSILEAVLLSITPSFASRMMSEKPELGKKIDHYKKNIDRPLSAILTLNTIAHTVGAIGVGAQASIVFGDDAANIAGFNVPWEGIIAAVMTLLILILSEIIPKTLGATYWKGLTPFTISALKVIIFLLYPFVLLSEFITKFLKSKDVHSVFSREDYMAMTNLGGESGALVNEEKVIINNLLNMDDLKVTDIMTPRSVIHSVEDNMTLQAYYDDKKDAPFSRIPIYSKDLDQLSGFVLKDDILKGIIDGKGDKTLSTIQRKIAIINDNKTIREFFNFMNGENQHLAVVANEFGSIAGIVSLEDAIETLLGYEITDENDDVADLQAYARQKWNERAKKIGIIE